MITLRHFARWSRWNAMQDYRRRQHEASAPLKGWERYFLPTSIGFALLMGVLYTAPNWAFVVWLRLFVLNLAFLCIGGCVVALTALVLAGSIGQAVVEAWKSGARTKRELDAKERALQAVEAAPEITTPMQGEKLLPELTDVDRVRIANSTNPKLNEETAARIKPYLAADYTLLDTASLTGLSLDTVKKYSALLRRGLAAPLSVEWGSEN